MLLSQVVPQFIVAAKRVGVSPVWECRPGGTVSVAKVGPDRVAATADRQRNALAAIGLGLGAVFGLAGTVVAQPNLQQVFWAIDSAGLVMAASPLCLKFCQKGNQLVGAGFLGFALGESVILSGTAAGGGEPSTPGR